MRNPVYIYTNSAKQNLLLNDVNSELASNLTQIDSRLVSFWIVDEQHGNEVISTIRQHPSPQVYLRPILLLRNKDKSHRSKQTFHGDEEIDMSDFSHKQSEKFSSTFEKINQWIEKIPNFLSISDDNLPLRLLRFIVSRDIEIVPVITTSEKSGYVYPTILPFFEKADIGALETLSFLHEQHLLNSRFISKTHQCNHCNSAFLNFIETCTQCESAEIEPNEIIHHFKCAYTGEASEFFIGGHKICPKCDQELHHIGVDYDKPSVMFHCLQCSHTFQEPSVSSTCFNCGRNTLPENLLQQKVHAFSPSSIGNNAGIYGLESLFTNFLKKELNLYTPASFKDFVKIEASRIKRYKKTESVLMLIQFSSINELQVQLGHRSKHVFSELSNIFKSFLRESDVISAQNESLFEIVLTETNFDSATSTLARLQKDVNDLFEENLNISPTFLTHIERIDEHVDVDRSIESMLNKNAD